MKLGVQKGSKLIVRIPRTGKISLLPGSKITVDRAVKEWAKGFMSGVREHPTLYKRHGVKEIIFTFGKRKVVRKI